LEGDIMATVRMQRGDLVTHVYGDPKTIADAEKKGFRLVDAQAEAESTDEAESRADTTVPEPSDGLLPGATLSDAQVEAGNRNGGSRRKPSG